MIRNRVPAVVLCFAAAIAGESCSETPDSDDAPALARGRKLYRDLCGVSCHHPDPRKEHSAFGTFGPPIAGSSLELIRLRVLTKDYPKGYTPKRSTSLMTTFQLPDEDLRALHAFVNSQPDDGESADAKSAGAKNETDK